MTLPFDAQTRKRLGQLKKLTPGIFDAWRNFDSKIFEGGAIPAKQKELMAVACAHVTSCAYCIEFHTREALAKGATEQEIAEAIWVGVGLAAGKPYTHSHTAWETVESVKKPGEET